jgi:hypothetical protein
MREREKRDNVQSLFDANRIPEKVHSHAADIFFLLNLLALQFHTILEYCDLEYQITYSTFPVRVAFFEALRVLIRRRYFASWAEFLQYARGKDEGPS